MFTFYNQLISKVLFSQLVGLHKAATEHLLEMSGVKKSPDPNAPRSNPPIHYSTLGVDQHFEEPSSCRRSFGRRMRSSRLVIYSSIFVAITVIVTVTLVITLSPNSGGPPDYESYLLSNVNTERILKHIEALSYPAIAGSTEASDIAKYIHDTWISQGLSDVNYINYTVSLSKPPTEQNKVTLLDKEGDLRYEAQTIAPNIIPNLPDEVFAMIPPAYAPFSGEGKINGSLVYVNYGSTQDFEDVKKLGVDVDGCIIIVRYSNKIFPGDVVRLAENKGVIGVIFYSDPAEVVLSEPQYPKGLSATGKTYRLTTLRKQGDLLTPNRAATDDAMQIPLDKADLPKIPVQPIGYEDAWHFLSVLEGAAAPDNFIGGLDLTYRLGSSMKDGVKVGMDVTRNITRERVTCVMGSIKGISEPDRYIIIGGHHDSWGAGGTDPSTAVLLEVSNVIMNILQHYEYKLRRTIVFVSWSGSEQGLIGSNEFVEQFQSVLTDRAVIYIDHHMVMEGRTFLRANTHPVLYRALEEITKEITNPNKEEFALGRGTIYDSWQHHTPSSGDSSRPLHHGVTVESDCASFIFKLGIPCLDFKFSDVSTMPLFQTPYDSKDVILNHLDPSLDYHRASARMLALLLWLFGDKQYIPYNLDDFRFHLNKEFNNLNNSNHDILTQNGISIDKLQESIKLLSNAVIDYMEKKNTISSIRNIEIMNDAAMLLMKEILSPTGLPDRPYIKYVLDGPSYTNSYASEGFPGVYYLLSLDLSDEDVKMRLKDHIDSLTIAIQGAAQVLNSIL